MIWIAIVACIVLAHLAAIILGRRTEDRLQRTAFASGLVGLFSIPLVLWLAIKSFCIAGMCRHVDNTGLYLSLAALVLLALLSAGSAVALGVRRSRA
jgi:hypothetical protein